MKLLDAAKELCRTLAGLEFGPPVTHVYNPLDYARPSHLAYLETYADSPREIVLLGMNPGPWGMAQTGVPFGEVAAVREWMGIEATIGRPENEHPKRPVLGLACPRSEVSGRRLWGWARERFGTAEAFFRRIGTTLQRTRLEQVEFQGEILHLPVAPLEATPAGDARHDPIGDYTRPLQSQP